MPSGKENFYPTQFQSQASQSHPTPTANKARMAREEVEMEVDNEQQEEEEENDTDDEATQRDKKDEALRKKRETRAAYRKLQASVDATQNDLANTSVAALGEQIAQANTLFKGVMAPSEAILDSRVLLAASEAGARKARQLKLDSMAFDTDEFVGRLGRFLGFGSSALKGKGKQRDEDELDDDEDEDDFDQLDTQANGRGSKDAFGRPSTSQMNEGWTRVGRIFLGESRRIPGSDYMNGVLKTELKVQKVRTQRAKQKVDESQRVRGEELQADDIAKDPQATDKMVAAIKNVLDTRVPTEGMPYLRFIINPASYAQTVENMFYFAFCIKLGDAAIMEEDDKESEWYGDWVVYTTDRPEEGSVQQKSQLIVELTQQVWKDAIEAYEITESVIPTREVTHTKSKAKWQ